MNARHPADSLVGIPWKPFGETREGVSCWGLVVLYYRELLGVALPNFAHEPDAGAAIGEEIQRAIESGEWGPVSDPHDGDVVTMAHKLMPTHLGIYAAGRVLHITAWFRCGVVSSTPAQLAAEGFGRVRYWRRRAR